MKRFVYRPLYIVLSIIAIIAIWASCHTYKWHYEWLYKFGLIELPPTAVLSIGNEKFIAHAGGGIDGIMYTNSNEAFIQAIEDGYRFIEFDLRMTLDGHYFGAHKIDCFNEMTGHSSRWLLPPTASQVKERRLYDKYTPLLLSDIDEILDEHPDMILVVDKGEDYHKMIAECPLPNRMIIEVSTVGQYIAARHAGFPYVAFNNRDFDSIDELGIKLIVAKSWWNPNDADLKQFMDNGGVALVAGFDYAKDIPEDWLKANALFYVDFK